MTAQGTTMDPRDTRDLGGTASAKYRSLKIVLAPVGTRGDVQPLLALGLRLVAAGHRVVVCAPENDRAWVEAIGLKFASLAPDLRATFKHFRDAGALFVRAIAKSVVLQFRTLLEAADGADAIVGANLQIAGPSVAELLRVPYYYVLYSSQLIAPREQPLMGLPIDVPSWLDRSLRRAWPNLWDVFFRDVLGRERRRLGLPPVKYVFEHVLRSGRLLFAFDPALSPIPAELERCGEVTGPWYFDRERSLAPTVDQFIAQGPPPIYMGFGSMPCRRPGSLTELLVRAAERSGARAIISAGWAGLGSARLPPSCLGVESLSHSAVLPSVRAAIHHGGAGTIAAAARAGVPQIIVPHFGDQFYWARRIYELGLGPEPIYRGRLTAENLAGAILGTISNQAMIAVAKSTGERMRQTDGLSRAVHVIQRGAHADTDCVASR